MLVLVLVLVKVQGVLFVLVVLLPWKKQRAVLPMGCRLGSKQLQLLAGTPCPLA